MSIEEDVELRDLVTQTLEVNGCLSKIRAELRASIFLALDEDEEKSELLGNKKTKAYLESEAGRTMFCLVREFLEFFDLNFTISVYEPESYMGTAYQYEGRSKIIEDLGISQLKENSTLPLLLQLMQLAQLSMKTENIDINLTDIRVMGEFKDTKENKDLETANDTNKTFNVIVDNSTVLNETFNVSIPTVTIKEYDKAKADLVDQASDDEADSYSRDQAEVEISPPILKDKSHKYEAVDKLKLSSQKNEKLKSKSSLSSLADLPPLQLNKSRNDTMLLPSLYSREFKSNQNLKELDKLFDLDSESLNNYEEDFMSESDLNLSKTSDHFQNDPSSTVSSYKNSSSAEIKSNGEASSVTSDDLLNSPT